MYENIEYFVYMKDNSRIAGVLSNSHIEQLGEHLLYFSTAIFNKDGNYCGIPAFFDILFVSQDDEELIVREYKNCYLVDCVYLMKAADMQIMKEVKIYFEERNILDINRNI